ncbi:hypothetical protein P1J24_31905, partial [Pseudomonas aeruginosa]|nr:hypothetical protein [Pseudomonas aeruginosa]
VNIYVNNNRIRQDNERLRAELRDALAEIAELEKKLAMASDAASKGDAARHAASGMEMEIQELKAKLAEQAQHSVPQAWLDVQAERRRQVEAEGWTPEHDDGHACDEIAAFACYYAMPPAVRDWDASSTGYGATLGEAVLPEGWKPKTGDRRRELVKACALSLAEIERLDRADLGKEDQP